jgi:CRISPR/Cas system-associated protein Csm6
MNAKTVLISILVIGAIGVFVIYQIFNGNQSLPPITPAQGYKDGQYTGSVASNNYGDVTSIGNN